MPEIVFWQRIISPHMALLAQQIATQGMKVTYVAEQEMSPERAAMGWQSPDIYPANQIIARNKQEMLSVLAHLPPNSVHICQGLRANGPVGTVQQALWKAKLKQWAIIETVDDSGMLGVIKNLEYARLCRRFRRIGEGILAIGHSTSPWLVRRGMPSEQIAQFAYFLPKPEITVGDPAPKNRPVRFVFVGQLISRKRVNDLIEAVSMLPFGIEKPEVWIVGDGPENAKLRALAEVHMPGGVKWLGAVPQTSVPEIVSKADCLVLPSRFDGWGAVVSEALMVGTPAVCSDNCGVSGVVQASGVGGVYTAGNVRALSTLLEKIIKQGPLTLGQRAALRSWAEVIGAKQGAEYLCAILLASSKAAPVPSPPWLSTDEGEE
jgi:glycosyltransferase involved in cell wall biosynthesis